MEAVGILTEFSDAIASPIYVVEAGPKAKAFRVHSALLEGQSAVLEVAFNSNYFEGETKTIELEDLDPNLFSVFLKYLYNPDWAAALRPSGMLECLESARLYVLADRLMANQFKTQALHWYNVAFATLKSQPESEEDPVLSSAPRTKSKNGHESDSNISTRCTERGEFFNKDGESLGDEAFRLSDGDIPHFVKLLTLIAEEIRLDDGIAHHALWLAKRNLSQLAREPSFKLMIDEYPEIAKALCLRAADSEEFVPRLPLAYIAGSASKTKPVRLISKN